MEAQQQCIVWQHSTDLQGNVLFAASNKNYGAPFSIEKTHMSAIGYECVCVCVNFAYFAAYMYVCMYIYRGCVAVDKQARRRRF